MRDATTDEMGVHLTEQYVMLDFQGKPNEFVKFACDAMGAVAPRLAGEEREEASFIMPTGYGVMYCYHNQKRDAWFAKF